MESLDANVYTAYKPIDKTSELYTPALKAIQTKLRSGLAHKCARYAVAAAPAAPQPAATNASPGATAPVNFFTDLVEALAQNTDSNRNKPADTTKESERKETIKRAKMMMIVTKRRRRRTTTTTTTTTKQMDRLITIPTSMKKRMMNHD